MYNSYLKSIEPLDDLERGRLLTALLEYSNTGIVPDMQGNEKFIFPTMQVNMDREWKKYDKKCEINRNNILQRYTTVDDGKQPNTDATKKRTKEKEITKEKKKENTKENIDTLFSLFWKVYPIRQSKAEALKAFKKIKPDQALTDIIVNAVNEQMRIRAVKTQKGEWSPEWKHPATWLNAKCWEDEAPAVQETPPEKPKIDLNNMFFKKMMEEAE